ncbi:MAG: arabinofuranosidase [Phycisphaerales bacterium]|nr:arabinofuranosidase [Phycisphaerales bacterium]
MSDPNGISGSGPWLAFDLPNVWTDAAKTLAPSADGALIYTVADKSSGGFDATQSTSGSRMKWSAGDGFVEQEANVTQYMVVPSMSFNPTAFGICVVMEPLTCRETFDGLSPQNYHEICGTPGGSIGYYGDTGQFFIYDGSFRNIPLFVPSSRCCIIVTGSTTSVTIRINGEQSVYTSAWAGSTSSGAWQIGGGISGAYPVQGQWIDFIAKDHTFSASDISILEMYAQTARGVVFVPPAVVIIDGDSISYGALNTLCRNWPRQMRDGLPPGTLVYNLSQGGFLAQTAAGQIVSRILPLVSSSVPTIYIPFLGTNDLALSGRTQFQVYMDLQACCSQVKSANPSVKALPVTMLPRSGFTDATRVAFNGLITGGFATGGIAADDVADVGTIPAGQPGMDAYAALYPDGVHPTDGTSGQLARLIGPKITKLLFGSTVTQLATLSASIARINTNNEVETLPPGIGFWARADADVLTATGNPCADGDVVATWKDQSGNSYDATQTLTGNRPTFVADAVNGMPAIYFAGGSPAPYLTHNYVGPLATVFVVHKTTGSAGSNQGLVGGKSATNLGSYYFKATTTNVAGNTEWIYLTTADPIPAVSPFDWDVQASAGLSAPKQCFVITAGRANGTTLELWQQGLPQSYKVRSGKPIPSTGGIIGGSYVLTSGVPTPTDALTGYISEIIIYPRPLSYDEMAAVHKYLARWFGGAVTGAFVLPTWGLGGSADSTLSVVESSDGIRWTPAAHASYVAPTGVARDGGIWQDRSKGLWYFFHGVSDANVASTAAQIAISTEGRIWKAYATVDFSSVTGTSSNARLWAPKPFVDDDGSLYCIAACGSTGDPGNKQIAIARSLGDSLQTQMWDAPVVLTGVGLPSNMIDPFLDKVGQTYVLTFKNDDSTKMMTVATSSSLTSGYSIVGTVAANIEGGCRLTFDNNRVRLYYDRYAAGSGLAFRESTDGGITYGAEQAVLSAFPVLTPMRHGAPTRNLLSPATALLDQRVTRRKMSL